MPIEIFSGVSNGEHEKKKQENNNNVAIVYYMANASSDAHKQQ